MDGQQPFRFPIDFLADPFGFEISANTGVPPAWMIAVTVAHYVVSYGLHQTLTTFVKHINLLASSRDKEGLAKQIFIAACQFIERLFDKTVRRRACAGIRQLAREVSNNRYSRRREVPDGLRENHLLRAASNIRPSTAAAFGKN